MNWSQKGVDFFSSIFPWFSHDFWVVETHRLSDPPKTRRPTFSELHVSHQSVGGSSRQSCQASPSYTRWLPKILFKTISPLFLGKRSTSDDFFFQMGWFNHQLISICRSFVGQRRIQFSGFETPFEDLRNAPASSLPIHQQWNNLFMSNRPFRSFLLDLQIPLILAVNPRD